MHLPGKMNSSLDWRWVKTYILISTISAWKSLAPLRHVHTSNVNLFCALRASAVSRLGQRVHKPAYLCVSRNKANTSTRYAFQHSKGNWCSGKDLPIERWHRTTVHNETTWQLIRFVGLRLLLGCTTNAFGYRLKSWMPVIAFEVIRTTFRSANWNLVSFSFTSLATTPSNCTNYDCCATILLVDQFNFFVFSNYLSESGSKEKMMRIKLICFDTILQSNSIALIGQHFNCVRKFEFYHSAADEN